MDCPIVMSLAFMTEASGNPFDKNLQDLTTELKTCQRHLAPLHLAHSQHGDGVRTPYLEQLQNLRQMVTAQFTCPSCGRGPQST
jgi:hypothetical protein